MPTAGNWLSYHQRHNYLVSGEAEPQPPRRQSTQLWLLILRYSAPPIITFYTGKMLTEKFSPKLWLESLSPPERGPRWKWRWEFNKQPCQWCQESRQCDSSIPTTRTETHESSCDPGGYLSVVIGLVTWVVWPLPLYRDYIFGKSVSLDPHLYPFQLIFISFSWAGLSFPKYDYSSAFWLQSYIQLLMVARSCYAHLFFSISLSRGRKMHGLLVHRTKPLRLLQRWREASTETFSVQNRSGVWAKTEW